MKKIVLILIAIIIILAAVVYFFPAGKKSNDLSRQEITDILSKEKQGLEYIGKYPDFTIRAQEILTKDKITIGKNGKSFKELYNNLEMEDNRYERIDLVNAGGDRGLLAVIDMENRTPVNVYGLILLSIGK